MNCNLNIPPVPFCEHIPYYSTSLQWTHRDDGFITLWGHNSQGYQWEKQYAGVYSEKSDLEGGKHDELKSVEKLVVDKLFEDYEGKIVLLNTKSNRRKLGIKKKHFRRAYESGCPDRLTVDRIKYLKSLEA